MTNETPPTPITAEELLTQIINTLYDIPDAATITVPGIAIINRIRHLQSGFVPEGVRKDLSAQIGMLNDVKAFYDAEDAKTTGELTMMIKDYFAKGQLRYDSEFES